MTALDVDTAGPPEIGLDGGTAVETREAAASRVERQSELRRARSQTRLLALGSLAAMAAALGATVAVLDMLH